MAFRAFVPVACVGIAVSTLLWLLVARTGAVPPADTGQATRASPLVAAGPWTRLLGDDAVSPKPASPAAAVAGPQLRLVGLMASGDQGLALIAGADGIVQVFRVGAVVHGDTVVKSVSAQEVRLGPRDGPASSVLVLPTGASGGIQAITNAPYNRPPATDDTNDTSPIVPPHTDMPTPRASESGTAGSHWSELRAKPVTQ